MEFILTYCVICALVFLLVLLGALAFFCLKGVLIILGTIWYGCKQISGCPDMTLDSLKNERSTDGKLVVRNVKRSIFSGFYSAEIVDAETGQHVYSAAAKDIDELDNRLASELDWWSRHPVYKK